MFDIIGAARLDDRQEPLPGFDQAFTGEPWQNLPSGISKSVDFPELCVPLPSLPWRGGRSSLPGWHVSHPDGRCIYPLGCAAC